MTNQRLINSLSLLVNQIYDDMNKLQTLSVRSRNSQQKLVGMFETVSETIQNAEFKNDLDVEKVVEQYIKIAQEHEFSGETFQEMNETVASFISYTNIMFGYLMAGKDMANYEGIVKRSKRQCRRRPGRSFQREWNRLRRRLK